MTRVSGPDDAEFEPLDLGDGLEVPGDARDEIERGWPPSRWEEQLHDGALAIDRDLADVIGRHPMVVWLELSTEHLDDRVPHHPVLELARP